MAVMSPQEVDEAMDPDRSQEGRSTIFARLERLHLTTT